MNNSAIEVIGYDKCTGCYGCLNNCPVKGAIEFNKTEEGFYKPFLTEKCIQCGMCKKGCPVIKKVNSNLEENLEVYSCWSKDEEIVKNSSSGGIFSELAKEYLANGDIVFGAKWQDGEIVHCGISKLEELKELQKSKYLQSKVETSYLEVKKHLNAGKRVLFVGTPCQIAALNTIVNHENLVTVDLICHGIPSYSAYEKYIRENFNLNIKNVTVDFRNKDTGWENYNLTFKNKDQIIIKNNHRKDLWFRGFLTDTYLNKPCYNCEFRTLPRFSDITLGDFWGVPVEVKNSAGTSVVTINSKKGKELFVKISSNLEVKDVKWETALKGNPCLYNYKMDSSRREGFYKDFSDLSFEDLQKKHFPFPNKYIFFIRRVLSFVKTRVLRVIRGA
ncbi:Coenzyme F420 hydrogenase/dehydrogenase, beta subunit C-terminal domain [Cetobacterium sp.]|uniref:Coenzyme F420 hydrogenase/dehydrogenase, beta subunit C-terminal domain n=1 Tax=Cetobacterium sp. TaxID=2071632 RepID=UPI003F391622